MFIMKKMQFSTDIQAPAEKVWQILWGDQTYSQWTHVFSEGSRAITDWEEGSRVQFLDGKGEGMYSTVARSVPNTYMAFQHLGEVKNGKELPVDEKSKQWSGSMEEYTLEENEGRTHLTVDLDATEEMEQYMQERFPKALEKVKELAEK